MIKSFLLNILLSFLLFALTACLFQAEKLNMEVLDHGHNTERAQN